MSRLSRQTAGTTTSQFLLDSQKASRIKSRKRVLELKQTLESTQAINKGDFPDCDKDYKMAKILNKLDQWQLVHYLYDQIEGTGTKADKQAFFALLQEVIDKIYGVETEIIDNAQKRFMISGPENFEELMDKDEETVAFEKLQTKVKNWKSEETKEKEVSRAIFLATPDKVSKQKLSVFLKQYNYFINKLLIAKSDPFIEKQNKLHLRQRDADELYQLKNVFDRLKNAQNSSEKSTNRRASIRVQGGLKSQATIGGKMNAYNLGTLLNEQKKLAQG